MTGRDDAADLLIHYFRVAFTAAGKDWDSDYSAELRDLVDRIVDAAVAEAANNAAGRRVMSNLNYSSDCHEHHGLVRDFGARERPRIVCLCGSTRFYDAFQRANYERTMAGEIVLSVGFYPHAQAEHGHGEGVGHDSAEKVELDELHKRKIDLADYVLVLNVGGYVGDSTRSEIAYAYDHGKDVQFLERAPLPAGGA